jgi:hypothetical protein
MAEIVRELVEKRDLYTKHYLNDDGTITAEIHSSPIHYKTETGEYDDIDLTIVPEQNWEFEYALKKNTLRAYFNDATDIENSTLVGVELINNQGVARWITFKMLDAAPAGSSYEANRFKYHNVFPNVDVEYTVTPERLKENIIVRDSSALQPFTFTLKLDDGLEMQVQSNNDIHFIDRETGEVLWKIEAPFAVDSSEERKQTNNVIYTFGKAVYQGVEYDSITVEIQDDEFLENAVYPIEIDPSISINDTDLITQDGFTYTGDSTPNTGNHLLQAGYYGATEYISYFRINDSKISFLKGKQIISADFGVHVQSGTFDTAVSIKVYPITSSWSESGLVWSNRPTLSAVDSGNAISFSVVSAGRYYYFDAKKPLQYYADSKGPFYGLALAYSSATNNGGYINIHSIENPSGYKPIIRVVYSTPPSAPIIISPSSGQTLNKVHIISWQPSTDPDKEQYIAMDKRDVVHSDDTGQVFVAQGSKIKYVGWVWKANSNTSTSWGTAIYNVDENGIPTSQIYYASTSGPVYDQPYYCDQIIVGGGASVVPGNKYVLYVTCGGNMTFYGDAAVAGNNGGLVYYNGSTWVKDPTKNMALTIVYEDMQSFSYQIQLSTDNGYSWKDIVAMTSLGATSYSYDFTNEPQTNQAKIRIRAYDGLTYGQWVESGVFSIIHKVQIGTIKVQTPTSLLTIPIYDPNVGMEGKNQLRIQTPRGIGCFELVPINDPKASPIRVYTPSGVKAIAKQ